MSNSLRTLAYTSKPIRPLSEFDLLKLYEGAQRYNASANVTGLLVFDDDGFLQTLEGTPDAISDVFKRIGADPTHHGIQVFADESIETRAYSDWLLFNVPKGASKLIQVMLHYALGKRPNHLTSGQIAALERSLARVS